MKEVIKEVIKIVIHLLALYSCYRLGQMSRK